MLFFPNTGFQTDIMEFFSVNTKTIEKEGISNGTWQNGSRKDKKGL